jgi:hypothetical protein
MDYSESIIALRYYLKHIEISINNRNFEKSLEIAKDITAEAVQLKAIVGHIVATREELL